VHNKQWLIRLTWLYSTVCCSSWATCIHRDWPNETSVAKFAYLNRDDASRCICLHCLLHVCAAIEESNYVSHIIYQLYTGKNELLRLNSAEDKRRSLDSRWPCGW